MLQGTQKIMKQGSPILTGSALDLNISGTGFFVLSPKEDADPRFTRDGSFSLDATGNLITTEGFNVAGYERDQDGNINYSSALPLNIPLTVEEDGKLLLLSKIDINNRGHIETTYGLNTIIQRGQVALAKFNNGTGTVDLTTQGYTGTRSSDGAID